MISASLKKRSYKKGKFVFLFGKTSNALICQGAPYFIKPHKDGYLIQGYLIVLYFNIVKLYFMFVLILLLQPQLKVLKASTTA